ncbi:MAG: EAL domain-containing protein [Clostridiales bacterium]|nr:EAL domain-containing protein [Clostridiales bacterium]
MGRRAKTFLRLGAAMAALPHLAGCARSQSAAASCGRWIWIAAPVALAGAAACFFAGRLLRRSRRDSAAPDDKDAVEAFGRNPMPMAVLMADGGSGWDWATARIDAANEAFSRLTGKTPSELVGMALGEALPMDMSDAQKNAEDFLIIPDGMQESRSAIEVSSFELGGRPQTRCAVFIEKEIRLGDDQQRLLQKLEHHYQHKVYHDSLTDLLNRDGMRMYMEKRFEQAKGSLMMAMFMDLDNFKMVNDMYGHEAGDEYIRRVGRMLRDVCPDRCLVSRLSGDEFLIMDPAPVDRESCRALARDILHQVAALHPNEFIEVKASIGIAYYPENATDRSTLMSLADIAMYKAKTEGGNRLVEYADTMKLDMLDEYHLKRDLRAALSERQLTAWYQPVVDSHTGQIMSFETLVRWKHPQRGLLMPAQFIPIAQRAGLLPLVDLYMIEKALSFAREINDGRGEPIRVAVNVTTDELSNDDFITQAIELTQKSGTPPGLLRLEVKEGDASRDIEMLCDRIDRLSAAGIGVALDDFGRNHSALSLVGTHRFDIIKMNDAYTHSVSAPLRRQLLSILMNISRQVGFSVVLEGVETPEQDRAVQDLGIRYMQGHFIAKPIPETEVMDWVARYDGRSGGKQPCAEGR